MRDGPLSHDQFSFFWFEKLDFLKDGISPTNGRTLGYWVSITIVIISS